MSTRERPRRERQNRSRPGRTRRTPERAKSGNKGLLLGLGLGIPALLILVFILSSGNDKQAARSPGKLPPTKVLPPDKELSALIDQAKTAGVTSVAGKGALKKAGTLARRLPPSTGSIEALLNARKQLGPETGGPDWWQLARDLAGRLEGNDERLDALLSLVPECPPKKNSALFNAAYTAAIGQNKPARLSALTRVLANLPQADQSLSRVKKRICRKLVTINPDHAVARKELGFWQVPKPSLLPHKFSPGTWIDPEEKLEYDKETEKRQLLAERWEKTDFGRACWKKRKKMENQNPFCKKKRSRQDWFFFFADGATNYIKKPFLVAIEEDSLLAAEDRAKIFGYLLNSLVTTFRKEYSSILDDRNFQDPKGIFLFKSKDSYRALENRRKDTESISDGVQGFFVPSTQLIYLWVEGLTGDGTQAENMADVLCHEATHQLMDSCKTKTLLHSNQAPWLQEGIAEMFGGVRFNRNFAFKSASLGLARFIHGQVHDSRIWHIREVAEKLNKGEKLPAKMLDLRQIIAMDYDTFNNLDYGGEDHKNQHLLIYAGGWSFIHFCYCYTKNGKDGWYRDKFRQLLKVELTRGCNIAAFEKIFFPGKAGKQAWDDLQKEFIEYVGTGDSSIRKYKYDLDKLNPFGQKIK